MSASHDELPLERELAGLPELKRFANDADRAAALRSVHRRIENPHALSYWVWIAVLLSAAIGGAMLVNWALRVVGAPTPFPGAIGLVAGVATYFLLRRMVVRWAARPELQRELTEHGIV